MYHAPMSAIKKWDLSAVPYKALKLELVARRKSKPSGPEPSCDCMQCAKCKMREYQRARREKKLEAK